MQDELNNKIEGLSSRIDEQSNLIEEQDEKILALEEKPVNLDRYLDNQSKDIIEEIVSDRIFDVVWDDYFYYSTFIESVSRYFQFTNAGGGIIVNANGLNLDNDTGSTAIASVSLNILDIVSSADILSFDKETKFRTQVKIDDVSEVDLFVNGPSALLDGIGFQINDGTIKAQSTSNGSTTSLDVGTVADDTYVKLEFRYYPGAKIDFFVDEVEKGTITTNLPRTNVGTDNIFDASLEKNAVSGATRTGFIMFYDVIQRK